MYEISRFIEEPIHAHFIGCLFFSTYITPIDCDVIKIKAIILDARSAVWVKNAIPNKNSKNGYDKANPGMFFARRSYLEKVMLNPFMLSNFRKENRMKNIPIYETNQLFKTNVFSAICMDKEEIMTTSKASKIGFLDFK